MKPLLIPSLLAALAPFAPVQAQNLSQCTLNCLDQAASANGCDTNDAGCVCTNQDLLNAAVNCALNGCTVEDVNDLGMFFNTECTGLAKSASPSPNTPTTTTTSSTLTTSSIHSSLPSETRSSPSSSPPSRTQNTSSTTSSETNRSATVPPTGEPTVTSTFSPTSASSSNPVTSSADGGSTSPAPTATLVETPHSTAPISTSSSAAALPPATSRIGTGAVVGIAVGASAVTAVCLASALFVYAKRRRRRAAAATQDEASRTPPNSNSGGNGDGGIPGLGLVDEVLAQTDGASLVARGSFMASGIPDYSARATSHPYRQGADEAALSEKELRQLRDGDVSTPGDGPRRGVNGPADTASEASVFPRDWTELNRRDALQETDGRVRLAGGRAGGGLDAGDVDIDQYSTLAASTLPPPYSESPHFEEPC